MTEMQELAERLADMEVVAWRRQERQTHKDFGPRIYITGDAELAKMWRYNEYTEWVEPLVRQSEAAEAILTLERERGEARAETERLQGKVEDLAEYEGNALNERDAAIARALAAEAQVQALREALERSVGALNMLTEPDAIKVTNVSGAWAECVAALSIARAALGESHAD